MHIQLTARELAKCDARHRAFKQLYAIFDYLDPACRAALREDDDGWDVPRLRRCQGRVCNHVVRKFPKAA